MLRSLRLIGTLGGGLILLCALVLMLASLGTQSGWIAFISDNGSGGPPYTSSVIYRMRPDGSDVQPLSKPAMQYVNLEWSPDGRRIAFSWNAGGIIETDWVRINDLVQPCQQCPFTYSGAITWSPDSRWLIYSGQDSPLIDGNSVANIRRISVDKTSLQRLTNDSGVDMDFRWSPDGQWIAFVSDRDGNWEIYRMRPDGSDQQRLTFNLGEDYNPEWFPDSRWLLFVSRRSGSLQTYRMRADGIGLERLTRPPAHHWSPSWSPDGRWIAFVAYDDVTWDLYRMHADGSDQQQLITGFRFLGNLDWSPDGRWIMFVSGDPVGINEIYRIQADGTDLQQLTTGSYPHAMAKWSPPIRRNGNPWRAAVIGVALLGISLFRWRRRPSQRQA
jgi:Tol biopolymer transport system component